MPKPIIDRNAARRGTSYPPPHDEPCRGRTTWPLTSQLQLSQFGVNLVHLEPGAWSTQKHWHKTNDELVVMIAGELVVVTDEGEETIRAGECYAFKAGVPNAHHLQNRSDELAVYYDIGGRDLWDVSTFPDMGLEAKSFVEIRFRPIKPKA